GEPEHPGVPGSEQGDQDGNQASGADDFQGESSFHSHCELPRQGTAAGKVCRLPSRLEKSLRAVKGRREDAGVRTEPVRQTLVISRWSQANDPRPEANDRSEELNLWQSRPTDRQRRRCVTARRW